MDDAMRVFSFGGGVQSVAVMVLQVTGRITPYDAFVFANVGADSEHPATLAYLEAVVKPYAAANGLTLVEAQKTTRGEPETLLEYLNRLPASVPIPVWLQSGAPGRRMCTTDFKIAVVDHWIRAQGVSRAVVGMGISLDEYQRARDTDWHTEHNGVVFGFAKRREYPLLEARMTRHDCLNVIAAAGLPEPPRSACWFCPFTSRSRWIERKRTEPELFARAVALEETLNERRARLGRDRAYLHRDLRPLAEAVPDQLPLFPDDTGSDCDSGYCFI